jgi:hypothetical protein
MRPQAVTARLQTISRLLAERGFVDKGVDMSSVAVTQRLKSMAALSSLCLRLQKAKVVLTAGDHDGNGTRG